MTDKTRGFMNHCEAAFKLICPDNEPDPVGLKEMFIGCPNYKQACILIVSGLNIPAWEHPLHNYFDKCLIQYLKFAFPLSLTCPTNLVSTNISNHFSATSEVEAVTVYIERDIILGVILGSAN